MKKFLLLTLFFLCQYSLVQTMDRVEDNAVAVPGGRMGAAEDSNVTIQMDDKKKVPKLQIPRPSPSDLSPKNILNALADLSSKRDSGENSGSGSTSSPSHGKQVLKSIDEIHDIVRVQSTAYKKSNPSNPTKRKRRISTVEIASDDSQKSTHTIDPHYLQTNELRQNLEELINDIAAQYHIEPGLFIECRFRHHGERNKTPRPFEEEEWKNIMNNRPEKYERMIKELLFEMMKTQLKNATQNQSHTEEKEEEERPSDFIDTHMGVLRNRIDNQEDTIARKNRLIFWNKVITLVVTLISIGATTWGTYAQTHGTVANCTQ